MSRGQFVSSLFQQQFGKEPEIESHAPGRVNLIGDHTDYNDGFVLPVAINFGTDIAASHRDDTKVRVYAHDCDKQTTEFDLCDIQYDESQMWSNYVRGTIKVLLQRYPTLTGVDMVVSGNVPQGAGLSSSASFEIAILRTLVQLNDITLDGISAAKLGQQAENEFVGCNCGIMDQLISAMGQKDHAMLLDCRHLTFEDAKIPSGVSLFIVNTNVKRGLVDSEYNLRREQCEQVAIHCGVSALRDVTIEQLESAKSELPAELYKRARHVITESARTEAALQALKQSDMAQVSLLMEASHLSMKDDFEITTEEVDGLVEIIADEIGRQGGVRMTGGGFGGCVVALIPESMTAELSEVVLAQYPAKFGIKPDIYICKASQGAFRDEKNI